MTEYFETKDIQERVVLVGVQVTMGHQEVSMEESLDELEELVTTAGAVSVGRVVQNAERIHPGYYVGTGKIEDIRTMLRAYDAAGIVCDDELSPSQINNLERELDCKVMDRTLIILDIFAKRATSSEGKIQVELAQLRYRAARLVGKGTSLSRLGGGIGTRGPGEKKLEVDRRLIHKRISRLKADLEDVKQHRDRVREQRREHQLPAVAIVGYTNAGKSTFLNHMTGSQVLAEDMLFATLDPKTRMLELEGKQQVLLTDTVGFIHKLPHNLIEAFQSTLEEARYADYIIHVVDVSNPRMEMQMQVVYETLKELGAEKKPVMTLFNKCDRVVMEERPRDPRAERTLFVSAALDEGLDEVKRELAEMVSESYILLERVFSYKDAAMVQMVRQCGQLLEEEYLPTGIRLKANVPVRLYGKLC